MGCQTSKSSNTRQGEPDDTTLHSQDAPPTSGDGANELKAKTKFANSISKSSESFDSQGSTETPPSLMVKAPKPIAGSAINEQVDQSFKTGFYEIVQNGTCVDDGPSFDSAEVAKLFRGTIVKVLEVATMPDIHRVRARIDSPQGWVSLLNIRNGHVWAVSVKFDSFVKDWSYQVAESTHGFQAGLYEIMQDGTCVDDLPSFGATEVAKLNRGATVEVLEVVSMPYIQRVRARITSPVGWISLLNTKDGYHFVKEKALASTGSPYQEPVTENAMDGENLLESIATTVLALTDDDVQDEDGATFQTGPDVKATQQLEPLTFDSIDIEVEDACDVIDSFMHKSVMLCLCSSARRVRLRPPETRLTVHRSLP